MCLDYAITTRPQGKYSTAYKLLEWDWEMQCWVTAIRRIEAKQLLIARGKPITRRGSRLTESPAVLHGGAIHCYRTYEAAHASYLYQNFKTTTDIFQVIGSGHVAHNETEIAFRQIKFVDRLEEWYIP